MPEFDPNNMTFLAEQEVWEDDIFKLENGYLPTGGDPTDEGDGILNRAPLALANRTTFLKAQVEEIIQDLDAFANDYTAADVLAKLLDVDGAGTGLDADLLDGREAAEFMWQLGTISDLDAVTQSGSFHFGSSAVGNPAGGDGRLLHLRRHNTEWSQIAITGHGAMFFRDKETSGSPPGDWRRLMTDEFLPAGLISAWSTATPPGKWLECDGSEISRTSYDELFAVIGTDYGVGDDATTFNLPDLRGEFLRCWDNGRGVDSGRAFGSFQADEIASHRHTYTKSNDSNAQFDITNEEPGNKGVNTANTGYFGGTETRPRNVALMFCIKY